MFKEARTLGRVVEEEAVASEDDRGAALGDFAGVIVEATTEVKATMTRVVTSKRMAAKLLVM